MTVKEKGNLAKKKWREENKERQLQLVREWRRNNPEKCKMYKLQWRARVVGTRVEKNIRKKDIYNWESKLCGICHKLIEGQYHIDHIIPLSRGGTHSLGNLQLAHPFCNMSKFTRLQTEINMVS